MVEAKIAAPAQLCPALNVQLSPSQKLARVEPTAQRFVAAKAEKSGMPDGGYSWSMDGEGVARVAAKIGVGALTQGLKRKYLQEDEEDVFAH